ncbi:WXG100 family type VII secretion target [Mycolicibacter minnesotensis]
MARRTVDEEELADAAHAMRQFCGVMKHRLDGVADGLTGLQRDWGGIAFDAFLDTVHRWQGWADEMNDLLSTMERNAHIAHANYTHNAEVNTAMWGG